MIGVFDYGVGNIVAISNLLQKIGVNFKKISSPDDLHGIQSKDLKVILPGVGSFDSGMRSLGESGLTQTIKDLANTDVQILGICLGMQLLFEESAEGVLPGLGLLKGALVGLKAEETFRVPHVGWQVVKKSREEPLLEGIQKLSFYHNHSFGLKSPHEGEFASIEYGGSYAVGVRSGNVSGVQFHPEKSHGAGEKLIRNFVGI
jgi:glutamine amidotransferase